MHMHTAEDRPPRVVSADAAMQADANHPPASTDWAELPRENAQVHDIALYKRERAVHSGSLIAVNANYTCYAIRGARFPSTAQSGSRGPTAARSFWQVAWCASSIAPLRKRRSCVATRSKSLISSFSPDRT